jgi:hypothetical protein
LEDFKLPFCMRRQLAPAAFITLSVALSFSARDAQATSLPRLAASLDLSHLAAAVAADVSPAADELKLAVPTRTVLPTSVELLGATTEVQIGLPHEADLAIEVTDESGALVCNAQVHMPAGWQKVCFSGRAHNGSPLPNGVYFYRVTVDGDVMVSRVVINR